MVIIIHYACKKAKTQGNSPKSKRGYALFSVYLLAPPTPTPVLRVGPRVLLHARLAHHC